jgi:TPR repeat protein
MNKKKGEAKKSMDNVKSTIRKISSTTQKKYQPELNKIWAVIKNTLSKQEKKPSQSLVEYVTHHKMCKISQALIQQSRASKRRKAEEAKQKSSLDWKQTHIFGIDEEHFKTVFSKPKIEASEASLTQLIKDAESGLPEAQYQLAECYQTGVGVPLLPCKAFYFFELAANQGHIGAQIRLGMLFEEGLGVAQSLEKAFYYYKLAADQGHRVGLELLGKCYEKGIGVKSDPALAFRCYQMSVSEDDSIGVESLARCYEEGIGIKKSPKLAALYHEKYFTGLKKEADHGDVRKQLLLGMYFEKGMYLQQSLDKAFYYYELAAQQNNPHACFLLGRCYAYGIGVTRSLEKAEQYYQVAVDQGDAGAQLQLGRLLLEKGQASKAFELFKLVSQSDFDPFYRTDSHLMLARCFEDGMGVQQSTENALHYYKLAASGEDVEAICRLGKAYHNGELGLCSCLEKAIEFYVQAAEQNNEFGQYYLGCCYEELQGDKDSVKKAMYYYKLVADQGYSIGQKAFDRLSAQQSKNNPSG